MTFADNAKVAGTPCAHSVPATADGGVMTFADNATMADTPCVDSVPATAVAGVCRCGNSRGDQGHLIGGQSM